MNHRKLLILCITILLALSMLACVGGAAWNDSAGYATGTVIELQRGNMDSECQRTGNYCSAGAGQ